MKYKLGDKVIVEGDWNFPKTCSGIISEPPDTAVYLAEHAQPWSGITRLIKGRKKLLRYYWVKFDEPQYDSDQDGPYYEGEVEDKYIKLKK